MSMLWIDELKKKDPELAAAYALVGNQSRWTLRNMVRALSFHGWLNDEEDKRRLAAARYILRRI